MDIIDIIILIPFIIGVIWRTIKIILWGREIEPQSGVFKVYKNIYKDSYDFRMDNYFCEVIIVFIAIIIMGAVTIGGYFLNCYIAKMGSSDFLFGMILGTVLDQGIMYICFWRTFLTFYYTLFFPIHLIIMLIKKIVN